MANDVGRPTILDDKEKMSKIKELVLEGVTHKTIQEAMDIPRSTWDTWINENYRGFRDILLLYKHERKLILAECVSDEVLVMSHMKGEQVDTGILTQKVKESQFIRETLGKVYYAKRTETTGADGQPLQIIVPKEVAEAFNIHATTQKTEGSNTE